MSLQKEALFTIPCWKCTFPAVRPYHQEMSTEIEESIDSTLLKGPSAQLAHQTAIDPFDLPSPGWTILERSINGALSDLVEQSFERWREGEFHIRRWGIRLGKLSASEKDRAEKEALHNHFPALFSSVYYLSIPEAIGDPSSAGTRFHNPFVSVSEMYTPRTNSVPGIEGDFIVFPSFLDHAPVPLNWDATGRSRLVIACDIFYVSGTQDREDDPKRVLRASVSGLPE